MRAPSEPVKSGSVDIEEFAKNLARMVEEGGRALAAYLKPREEGRSTSSRPKSPTSSRRSGRSPNTGSPTRSARSSCRPSLGKSYLDLWANAVKRMAGEEVAPVAAARPARQALRRSGMVEQPVLRFPQAGLSADRAVGQPSGQGRRGLDPHTRQKAEFYVRQIANAIAPSNFVLTNPELLRETLASNAENLVRGMHMLAEDIEAGDGDLKIRQSDASMFEVGRNLALTPGKVIFENELMQLIQYAPSTATVLKRPLLIVPPWINKFYILDLTPEKSFIKWCVDQGLTVFVDLLGQSGRASRQEDLRGLHARGPARRARRDREGDRREQGPRHRLLRRRHAARGHARLMAAKGDNRIASATLFATQVDFTHAGDLKVFVDEEQIAAREREMAERGYLEGSKMAKAFNLLRSNDLIWPYVINNYLKGKEPVPFDLLYWNSDATRMPAANHSFYLRNCYLDNKLSKGEMVIGGEKLDLKKVTVPIYNLATREDHIAPAKSVMLGSQVLRRTGALRAGRLRPYRRRGQSARQDEVPVLDRPQAARRRRRQMARQRQGASRLLVAGLARLAQASRTRPRFRRATPGGGKLKPIEDAPGSYVKVRD